MLAFWAASTRRDVHILSYYPSGRNNNGKKYPLCDHRWRRLGFLVLHQYTLLSALSLSIPFLSFLSFLTILYLLDIFASESYLDFLWRESLGCVFCKIVYMLGTMFPLLLYQIRPNPQPTASSTNALTGSAAIACLSRRCSIVFSFMYIRF